jgi:hypothetical protein
MAKMEYTEHEAKEIEAAEWSKVDRDRAKLLFKEVQLIRETVLRIMEFQGQTATVYLEISNQLTEANQLLAAILSAVQIKTEDGSH